MSGQWCFACGQNRPGRHAAVYVPADGGEPLYLVICETCGRSLSAEEFAQLAWGILPRTGGQVAVVSAPEQPRGPAALAVARAAAPGPPA
jgi:hypothetical protein